MKTLAMHARVLRLGFFVLVLLVGTLSLAHASQHEVVVLEVRGVIDPFVAGYVEKGINVAEQNQAELVIILLDTPGGLDSAMRRIVQKLLASTVPTAVLVYPEGARAASAGVFITAAVHIAAMAPSTNLGAAHPVALEGQMDPVMTEKVTNDAAATMRTIADRRHRNAQWLEDAVRKSVSATAREALELNVVDLIAKDPEDLLTLLSGKKVTMQEGERTLNTASLPLHYVRMNMVEQFLHVIADPNIAFLFISIGSLGIMVELFHPGWVVPGALGVTLIALGFVALGNLPVNWAGAVLILLGAALFAVEVFTPTFGVWLAAGLISFVVGALLLFSPFTPPSPVLPEMQVNLWLLAGITAAFAGIFVFFVYTAIRNRRVKPVMGLTRLIGARGITTSDLAPWGTVQVASELWSARTEGDPIPSGEEVTVTAVDGLTLKVKKV